MSRQTPDPAARPHPAFTFALLATLAALLAHSRSYRFLTDDAFISFRYARNLAHGHGLVFNPGFERVEGYSNFLWVLILAGLNAVGVAPETAAHTLSVLGTVALWALVVWFARRSLPPGAAQLWVLLPAFLLAITRSLAVWSTSGLETRWFEALALAGVLRLVVEVEAQQAGRPPGRPLAATLLGLACLTRPDGLLIAGCALVAAAAWLRRHRRLDLRRFALQAWPLVALVAAHFAFRRLYYGEWLPNTFYAKVGGATSWASGWKYLEAFLLEYGAYLWLLPLAAGVVALVRRGAGFVTTVFAATIVPHAIYVAAIGGDHFEYRPLDLYFPLLFLLIAEGARALARGPKRAVAVAAYMWFLAVGLWALPWQSRQEFPRYYISGFPGAARTRPEAQAFLDPARSFTYHGWPLRPVAEAYRSRLRDLTAHYVGIRQEEHRLFLASAIAQARRLRALADQGQLPRDLYVAISSVGAIPYYTDFRTLDRLGLTDARVARQADMQTTYLAHGKRASQEYAHERGVDVWAVDEVQLVMPVTANRLRFAVRQALVEGSDAYAAEVGGGDYLLGVLPQGPEAASRRMPRLRFQALQDPAFVQNYWGRAIAAWRDTLRRDSTDYDAARRLGYLLLESGRIGEARDLFLALAPKVPDARDVWENLALAQAHFGDRSGALRSLEKAAALALAAGDTANAERLRAQVVELERLP